MIKPKAKDFNTNDGMHAAMRSWALSQNRPTLTVSVLWDDSPEPFVETFDRATKEVAYKTPDGEVYSVEVDTSKYVNCFMEAAYELSVKELKEAFNVWIAPKPHTKAKILSCRWKLDK